MALRDWIISVDERKQRDRISARFQGWFVFKFEGWGNKINMEVTCRFWGRRLVADWVNGSEDNYNSPPNTRLCAAFEKSCQHMADILLGCMSFVCHQDIGCEDMWDSFICTLKSFSWRDPLSDNNRKNSKINNNIKNDNNNNNRKKRGRTR